MVNHTFLLLILIGLFVSCNGSIDQHLEDILQENLRSFGIKDHTEIFKNERFKRDKPGIHFETKKRQEANLPICQNMKGILGKTIFYVTHFE